MSMASAGRLAISATEIASLPVLSFSGRIKLVTPETPDDEGLIRDLLGLDNSPSPVVGFDTEAKPKALYATTRNRTALIQLASEKACVIWRTVGVSKLPSSLEKILADENIIKVGQGVGMDARDVVEDFPLLTEVKRLVDLHQIACRLRCEPKSLQGLVGIFLKQRLIKDMRVSNWEQDVLRAEQIHYAALDAWASRAVYMQLVERNIDVADFGRVQQPSIQLTPPVSVPRTLLSTARPPVSTARSAQVRLVETCIAQQLQLRLVGFEKVKFSSEKFTCVFEITRPDKHVLRFQSQEGHSSIRAAQEDAALVALTALSSPTATVQ